METQTIHCFEKAGLGKAPFTYIGMEYQEIAYGQRVVGNIGGCLVTTKPGGTCDYCGTYIVNMFRVRSSDNKTFKVGCECINKTGDKGLIQKAKKHASALESARRRARKLHKMDLDREFCLTETQKPEVIAKLKSLPHTSPTMTEMGKTLHDWAGWMMDQKHWETLAARLKKI